MQLWWFHERLLMQEGHSVFCCQDEELGRIVNVLFSNYFATSHRVRKFGASQTMPNIRLDNGFQYHLFHNQTEEKRSVWNLEDYFAHS